VAWAAARQTVVVGLRTCHGPAPDDRSACVRTRDALLLDVRSRTRRSPMRSCRLAPALLVVLGYAGAAHAQTLDRTVLPITQPDPPESTVLDARDTKAPPFFKVEAPAGAANVVIGALADMR